MNSISDHSNQTLIEDFILIGFTWNFLACILLFIQFFILYILTILGNIFLIFTVIVTPKLHTPMYYFLCNLSFLDLCYSSASVPRLLFDLLSESRRISFTGCIIQMYISLFLGGTEYFLLAVMAYDRYIAICSPLHYTTIMSWRLCGYITVIMYIGSFIVLIVPSMARPLIFCSKNILDHFMCEPLALLEVACGDLTFYKIFILVVSMFTLLLSPAFILGSYISIVISILKICSIDGRAKAFSTCASHLIVTLMFFGTTMVIYLGQEKSILANMKYISLIYIAFSPVLNPLIYSLRNNDVKEGFYKMLASGRQHLYGGLERLISFA